MAKISGPMYLVIGLFIIITSLAVDKVKLFLFAIIGAVMVVIGIIKVLTKKSPQKKIAAFGRRGTGQNTSQNPQSLRQCRYCSYPARPTDRYCGACGLPLGGFRNQ